ncbi:MAG: alanine dehydrogenase [Acidiferrobacterales bacterium]
MKVGVIKEIKDQENRIALTPVGARAIVAAGHRVHVQRTAGSGSGFHDEEFLAAGAEIVSADDAWNSDMVVKVKEPQEPEYHFLRGQIIFTYLHLAAAPRTLTERLLASNTTAVAYETVEDPAGRLVLLAPMSAVAGDMAITMGSYYLARINGGKGVLLGNVLGRRHGKVVIVGDGVVGQHAARAAVGLGARTYICGLFPAHEVSLKRTISQDLEFFVSDAPKIAHHFRRCGPARWCGAQECGAGPACGDGGDGAAYAARFCDCRCEY